MSDAFWALVLIALGLSMLLGKVPPNRVYRVNTPRMLASDAAWYRLNRIGGIALLLGGGIWLILSWS